MITYEDIVKANKAINTTDIKGKQYAEVNQRVKAFRMLYPNGTITTEIKSLQDGVVVMQATVKDEEGKILGTGLAYEKESSTFINKTSFIENCETSAIGRALGMCGLGIDTSIASKEEVENAMNNQGKEKEVNPNSKKESTSTSHYNRDKLINYAKQNNMNLQQIAADYKLNGKVTEERYAEVLKEMGIE